MKRPHFALPEIYDDSLSYYDVLRKLIKSMHVISDNLNKIPDQIANEAKARFLGDQNLQQNINAETSAREQADQGLQTNIDNEKQSREQADQEIREGVSDKISELKSDIADKLPKSPVNWEQWTIEEQAVARERMGIDKPFELIEEITLEEDIVSFIRSIDKQNKCKKVLILGKTPAGMNKNSRFIIVNNKNTLYGIPIRHETVSTYWNIYISVINGRIYSEYSASYNYPHLQNAKYGFVPSSLLFNPSEYIDNISADLPAGTNIKIYEVIA